MYPGEDAVPLLGHTEAVEVRTLFPMMSKNVKM
jgi:hypothetical protein